MQFRPSRLTAAWLALFLTLAGGQARLSQAQEEGTGYITIHGWAVHGYSDGNEIGYEWFRSRDQAEAAKAKMEKIRTTTGPYYDRVEIRPELREVPVSSFLPRPRLKPNMRPGDVLKEYKAVIQQAYRNVRDLKLSLSAQVETLTQTQFDQVNGLIKEINATRDQYSRETGDSFREYPRLSLIDADQLRPNRAASPEPSDDPPAAEQSADLAGTQWEASGTYISDMTLWFQDGGILAYKSDGTVFRDGRWSASGHTVQLSIPFLDYEVRGQIANGRLTSQATPSARGRQQGVVRSSFQMRKTGN